MFATNKIGDASMAETNDGFAVAVLTKITTPDRTAAPEDWNKLRTQLEQSMRGDIESTYTDALRSAAKVNINEARLNAAIE
jgi:peptidyl-prolyl cis-trans isomerase D